MNSAHVHLIVNHLPIIFPIVGVIVLLTGFIARSEVVTRTAWMIFILGAIAAWVAMFTGEGAEEVLEQVEDFSENHVERHEQSAEIFAILSYLLGAMSLIGLWASFRQKMFSKFIAVSTILFAAVVLFFAQQAGTTGGEIRHPEIRTDFNSSKLQSENNVSNNPDEKED